MNEKRQQENPQTPSETQKQIKKLSRAEKGVKEYQYFVIRLVVFLAVVWILFFQIVGLTHMNSGDMYPRLDAGDLLLFYRLDKSVKAQDIIVFNKVTPDSGGRKELFVCRVVAVAGDTVEITEDQNLIINGNAMVESNIFYRTPPYEVFTQYPIVLQPGQCFVLADSRMGGNDSRWFGPVNKKEILGTVITVVRRNNL